MDMNTYTELSPEIDHIIENVLKGTADQRESSLLKEWLAASPDNRRIFEQKRALHEVLLLTASTPRRRCRISTER